MNIWLAIFLVLFTSIAIPPFCYSIALSPESKKKIPLSKIYLPMGLGSGLMTLLMVFSLSLMSHSKEEENKKCKEKGGVIFPYSPANHRLCVTPETLESFKKGIVEVDK